MRAFQFWILIVGSICVTGLLIKQVLLNREIDYQQRLLVDNEETISDATKYSDAWRDLAVAVFSNSRQDPTLAAVLKDENVGISLMAPDSSSTNAPSTQAPPPAQ
jgi:hypothetical protein